MKLNKRPVNRWLELKNDESMTILKKMTGFKRIKVSIREVEKFFNWYNKIKTNELDSDNYWKRTNDIFIL